MRKFGQEIFGEGRKAGKKIKSGFVCINEMIKSDLRLTFGGIKKFGVGRERSHSGFKEFVNIITLVV